MNIAIYHNPRCSKSRKTLEILKTAGIEPQIVAYLDTPPAAAEIVTLAKQLEIPVNGLLRRNESEFRDASDLPALDDDTALATWLANHPKVIERPIVVDRDTGRAVIGRPPENVNALIDTDGLA